MARMQVHAASASQATAEGGNDQGQAHDHHVDEAEKLVLRPRALLIPRMLMPANNTHKSLRRCRVLQHHRIDCNEI